MPEMRNYQFRRANEAAYNLESSYNKKLEREADPDSFYLPCFYIIVRSKNYVIYSIFVYPTITAFSSIEVLEWVDSNYQFDGKVEYKCPNKEEFIYTVTQILEKLKIEYAYHKHLL